MCRGGINIKCEICGKKIDLEQEKKDYPYWLKLMKYWTINASIVGEPNHLRGHRACLQNVDNKIVIPERIVFMCLMRDVQKKMRAKEREDGMDKKED